jgi:hypothetical protein
MKSSVWSEFIPLCVTSRATGRGWHKSARRENETLATSVEHKSVNHHKRDYATKNTKKHVQEKLNNASCMVVVMVVGEGCTA